MIKNIVVLFSEHRLAVVANVFGPPDWQEHGNIVIWDWRNGSKLLVSPCTLYSKDRFAHPLRKGQVVLCFRRASDRRLSDPVDHETIESL